MILSNEIAGKTSRQPPSGVRESESERGEEAQENVALD